MIAIVGSRYRNDSSYSLYRNWNCLPIYGIAIDRLLSLDHYDFYFLKIWKETLTFLSLSNPVLQYISPACVTELYAPDQQNRMDRKQLLTEEFFHCPKTQPNNWDFLWFFRCSVVLTTLNNSLNSSTPWSRLSIASCGIALVNKLW